MALLLRVVLLLLACLTVSSSISTGSMNSPDARVSADLVNKLSETPSPKKNNAGAATTSSSSSTLTDSTDNIRSLDSYGHAVQLQHAQAAATKQGRSILAVRQRRRQDGSLHPVTWILYADDEAAAKAVPLYQRRRFNNNKHQNHPDSLIHVLYKSPGRHTAAIVCSGLQADAVAMIDSLQTYLAAVWERYDDDEHAAAAARDDTASASLPVSLSTGLAAIISQLCRRFWGWNDNGDESNSNHKIWQGSCWRSYTDASEEWGRPMGLQTLVVSAATLQLVDPSGAIRTIPKNVCWMGRLSEANQQNGKLQEALEQLLARTGRDADANDLSALSDDDFLEHMGAVLAQHEAFGSACQSLIVERFDSVSGRVERRVLSLLTNKNA